jgi:hypothetical protein
MKWKKSIMLLAVFMILAISNAMAATNFVLLYTKGSVSAYVDQDNLNYDGTIINSWLKININNKPYVFNYLFNTQTKQMKAVKQRTYDNKDNLIKEETINQDWEEIDEDNKILYQKLLEKVAK